MSHQHARTAIQDFATSNKLYVNAEVSFYTVSGGTKTTTLATLYTSLTGTTKAANPQTLDSSGKFTAPVYNEVDVIGVVAGLGNTPDHDTGIIPAPLIETGSGSPEGVITASPGRIYTDSDGGASTTLYVKESGTGNTGWVAK